MTGNLLSWELIGKKLDKFQSKMSKTYSSCMKLQFVSLSAFKWREWNLKDIQIIVFINLTKIYLSMIQTHTLFSFLEYNLAKKNLI